MDCFIDCETGACETATKKRKRGEVPSVPRPQGPKAKRWRDGSTLIRLDLQSPKGLE